MKEHGNASISSFNIFQRYCTQLTLSRYQYWWCHWNSVNSIDCKQDIEYVWPKSKCDCVQIVCTKVRDGNNRIVRLKEGEPHGRHVVIVDDLVQSGGTLIECQVWNYYIHTNVFTGLLRYLWDRSFSLEDSTTKAASKVIVLRRVLILLPFYTSDLFHDRILKLT